MTNPATGHQPSRLDRIERGAFAALLAMPPALTKLAAGKPHVVDGQTLDPQIQVGLRILSKIAGPELDELPIDKARAVLEQESWLFGGEPAEVASSRDLLIPGPAGDIPARLHLPITAGGAPADAPLPLLIWFHGGGWVLGSIESHEPVARAFCHHAQVAVLNVGYRLAPEHPFPAAFEDAEAAFLWAHEHATELGIDADRILLEDRSTSTEENLRYSLPMLRSPETDVESVGIVTNDFHVFRALCLARKNGGFTFYGVPARSTVFGFIHYAMREFFTLSVSLVRGYI